jgi:hypothetical protein
MDQFENLQALPWMIGRCTDPSVVANVESARHWTANRNFIEQSFKVDVEDRVDFEEKAGYASTSTTPT